MGLEKYKGSNINQAIELNKSGMPNQTYNMWAVAGAAVPSAILGVDAFIKNRKAKTDLKKQQGYVDTLMKNYMETPIYNPYENLSVATQANQIKMEETDKALANTLDTLRAQGASAGGATALAQAALRSKAGIAADIEKQEVGNERLKAQGEIMVQNAEMQRRGQQMDYEQSKADQLRMEQFAYGERAADMAGALGSLGLQAARGLGGDRVAKSNNVVSNKKVKETDDAIVKNITSPRNSGFGIQDLTPDQIAAKELADKEFMKQQLAGGVVEDTQSDAYRFQQGLMTSEEARNYLNPSSQSGMIRWDPNDERSNAEYEAFIKNTNLTK